MKGYLNFAASILSFSIGIFLLEGCASSSSNPHSQIRMQTPEGELQVKLYNETPIHRDHFKQLVEKKFYDGLLFHRVIKDFMIQGGDPLSRKAQPGQLLGTKDEGEPLMPEFRFPRYFHKRGALSAAREEDRLNPKKQSSGSQFFIVWGKTFTDAELNDIERSQTERMVQEEVNRLYRQQEKSFALLEEKGEMLPLQLKMDSLRQLAQQKVVPFSYPDSIRTYYKKIGGAPWLDGNYTVFGEVTKGLDVVRKIQELPTDKAGRPYIDIQMKLKIIK